MSATLAALALGASAISGVRSKNKGDDASEAIANAANKATATLEGSRKYIDEFSQVANDFALLGQDSYDKYNAQLGSVEKLVGDYYMNLNPDQYAAQGNQLATQEAQKLNDSISNQLQTQGVMTPAMKAQMDMSTGNQLANTKAQNTLNAPAVVAEMQSGWMNYNAGQQNNAQDMLSAGVNAQGNAANMYGNLDANIANVQSGAGANQANVYQAQSDNARSDRNMLIGSGLYFGNNAGWFGGGQTPTAQNFGTSPATTAGRTTDYSDLPQLTF